MPVTGVISVTLEVPDIGPGVEFYSAAGLKAKVDGNVARLFCPGAGQPAIILAGSHARKRLHHVTLAADDPATLAATAEAAGGRSEPAPPGQHAAGAWVRDPNGILYHLVERRLDRSSEQKPHFAINAPGRIVRRNESAIRPLSDYGPVRPRRLGHVLLFTPDVMGSVGFACDALGMGLADHSGEVIAFTCARKESDHHVLAFAKSGGIGFHHASFEVADPDEVGRGGYALRDRFDTSGWGFGRHTIGSNFFFYVRDPWGSWFEYYSDIDFIEDHATWKSRNYAAEDSLANWGPPVPDDFVENTEIV